MGALFAIGALGAGGFVVGRAFARSQAVGQGTDPESQDVLAGKSDFFDHNLLFDTADRTAGAVGDAFDALVDAATGSSGGGCGCGCS